MTDEPEVQPEDTTPVIVDEAPVEPAPEAAPASRTLKVRSSKVAADVVVVAPEAAQDAPQARSDGETRTETTDAGPVQLSNVRSEPREVDVLEFAGLPSITRERY